MSETRGSEERAGRHSRTSSRAPSRTSSRPGTPHRNRSKTPVRTPTRRRRATIVSANLMTPRRHRLSTTPQNMLRVLSRALARDIPPDSEQLELDSKTSEITQTEELVQEEYITQNDDIVHRERLIKTEVLVQQGVPQDTGPVTEPPGLYLYSDNDKDNGFDFSYGPEDMEVDGGERGRNQASPRPQVSLFSDIALPQGIMKDDDSNHVMSDPFVEIGDVSHLSLYVPDKLKESPKSPVKQTNITNRLARQQRDPLKSRRLFRHAQSHTKRSLAPECLPALTSISQEFFQNLADDLSSYAEHSKMEGIALKSTYLLLKRQRVIRTPDDLINLVRDVMPMEAVQEIKLNIKKLDKL